MSDASAVPKTWPPPGETLSDFYTLPGCGVCGAPPSRRHLASCSVARQDHAIRLRFSDGGPVVCAGCVCGAALPEGVDPDMWFVEHARAGAPRSEASAKYREAAKIPRFGEAPMAPSLPLTEAARRLGLTRKDEADLLGGLVKLALRNPLAALGGALLGGVAVYSAMAPTPKAEPTARTIGPCLQCLLGRHEACAGRGAPPLADCACSVCGGKTQAR